MKQLIYILSLIFIVTACTENTGTNKVTETNDEGFAISGELTGITGQTIYLEKIGRGQPIPVDSAVVDNNGKFELEGTTNIPEIFIIKINPNNLNLLLIDKGESINVTGDGQRLKDINIIGSPGTGLLIELDARLNLLQNKLDSLSQKRNEINTDPAKKQQLITINSEAQENIDQHKEYLKNFIMSNPKSLAVIAALYQQIGRQRVLTLESDAPTYKFADSSLMANFPTSIHVQNLHSGIVSSQNDSQQQAQPTSVDVGAIAPDISYPSPSGEVYTLSSLRGKYVLLDFWAAWCSPCRRENPTVVTNYKKYNAKGFEIFQVSLDKTKDAWIDAIAKDNLTWKYHVSDLKYWDSAPAKLYNVKSIPSNFLIDPNGKIIATNLRGPALGQKLAEIFGE